jgi:hypothetical protein
MKATVARSGGSVRARASQYRLNWRMRPIRVHAACRMASTVTAGEEDADQRHAVFLSTAACLI